MARQTASAERFVIAAPMRLPKSVEDRLGRVGSLEPLGEGLLLLQVSGEPASPGAAWQRVRGEVNEDVSIQPVLVDEAGAEHYPTGTVAVRLREEPSQPALEAFARRHGLRVRAKNEFVPSQVTFEPLEAARYLPKLVEELEGDPAVARAWAETISRYRRL
jgi:hypothetical protein